MWNYNFYVHITTNPAKTVLYIGVTNDLNRRLYEHAENKGSNKTFAGKSTAIIWFITSIFPISTMLLKGKKK